MGFINRHMATARLLMTFFYNKLVSVLLAFVVGFASAPRCFTLEEAITLLQEMVASEHDDDCHQETKVVDGKKRSLSEGRQCECEIADSHTSFPPPSQDPETYEIKLALIIANSLYQSSIKDMYLTPDPPPPRFIPS